LVRTRRSGGASVRLSRGALARSALAAAGLLAAGAAAAAGEAAIRTVAGSGRTGLGAASGPALEFAIDQPFGVELGADGSLYICEVGNHRVLRLDAESKRVETIAGNGRKGYSGDGGPALEASLNEPYEVRLDAEGDIYFVEMQGAVVRRVDARTRRIETIAGTGASGFSGDGGAAVKAQLRQPHSIALDGKGGLYIADIGNHRIRRVALASGIIETVAGTGERVLPRDGAVAAGSPIEGPRALHIAGGTLWIALREGHSVWAMDLETRRLSHIAGTGTRGYRDGAAKEAAFDGPKGIVHGPGEELFVVDTENQAIRRIDLKTRQVATVAGSGPDARGFGGDGGPAVKAKLDRPHGITTDARGQLYIGDTNNHRVRVVEP
jgi:sugar lactone lactonase YvrE